jgi:hypothetical protein
MDPYELVESAVDSLELNSEIFVLRRHGGRGKLTKLS